MEEIIRVSQWTLTKLKLRLFSFVCSCFVFSVTNKCQQRAHVPEWMTKGRTTLIQKDPNKEIFPNNYRPITCLPMLWKILPAQIRTKIYNSLTSCGLFPGKQRMLQRIQRHSRITLHRSTHPE